MNMQYNYHVISKDDATGVMVVRYTTAGKEHVDLSMYMPGPGETVADMVVRNEASVAAIWSPVAVDYSHVQVGQAGTLGTPAMRTLAQAKAEKIAAAAAWRWQREIAGVQFAGATIKTDPESQAKVTGAYIALVNGMAQTIDWKNAQGVFIQLNLAQMTAIAGAVVAHVQACFSAEAALVAEINAAQTIEAVDAIEFPDEVVA